MAGAFKAIEQIYGCPICAKGHTTIRKAIFCCCETEEIAEALEEETNKKIKFSATNTDNRLGG